MAAATRIPHGGDVIDIDAQAQGRCRRNRKSGCHFRTLVGKRSQDDF
jgi:hypothetical protein